MKFILESKTLADAVSSVSSTSGSDSVTITAENENLYVSAAKDGTYFTKTIPNVNVEDADGGFTIVADILNKLINRKGELSFESKDGTNLSLASSKGRRFSSTLNCLPFTEIEHLKANSAGATMGALTFAALVSAMPLMRLRNVYIADDMFLLVQLSDKEIRLAVYDNYHISYQKIVDENVMGNLTMHIPLNTFNLIIGLAGNEVTSIVVEENRVYAKNNLFTISVPKVSCSMDNQSLDTADAIDRMCEKKHASVKLKSKDLSDAVASSMAMVTDAARALEFTAKGDKLRISISSNYGSANNYVDVTDTDWKDGRIFRIEAYLLSDLLSCVPNEDVEVSFLKDKMFSLRSASAKRVSFYGCNLS